LEIVKLLAQDKRCTIKFINEALCCACSTGKLEVAEFLLKEMNADPNHYTSYKTLFEDLHFPLEVACLGGHDNVVKLLLKDPRVTVSQSDFDVACRNGKASVVNIFLSLPTFSPIDKSVAFTDACKRGFIEVVVLILKDGRIDPSFDNNEAFIEACKQSNLRIVELLLNDKRVDPSISDYAGLKNAILSKNTKVYKLLLRDTRINPNQKKCKIPELRKLLSKGQTMADLLK
jgi:ankyrin repeat protein